MCFCPKMLIDRRMYDRQGNYYAPKAIDVTKVQSSSVPTTVSVAKYARSDSAAGIENERKTNEVTTRIINMMRESAPVRAYESGAVMEDATEAQMSAREALEADEADFDAAGEQYSRRDNAAVTEMQRGYAEPGIHINDDKQTFTEDILNGLKTVETRNSPSLRGLVGRRIGIIRTGKGKQAMLVGYATISDEVLYGSVQAFRDAYDQHRVAPGSAYDIDPKAGYKWGYVLTDVERIEPQPVAKGTFNIRDHGARDMATGVQFSTRASGPNTGMLLDPNDAVTHDGIDISTLPSSGLQFNVMSTYTEERQDRIVEYLNAVDQRILAFYNGRLDGTIKSEEPLPLGAVPKRALDEINRILGYNLQYGYKTELNI